MKKIFLIFTLSLVIPVTTQALTYNELTLYNATGLVLGDTDLAAEIDNSPDDTTPPGAPGNFKAIGLDNQVALFWTNPADEDFVRTLIVKRSGKIAPINFNDGEVVYEGTDIGFVDKKVTNSQVYSYSAFAFDSVPNYSAGVSAEASPTVETKQLTLNLYNPNPNKTEATNNQYSGGAYKTGSLINENGTIYLIIGIIKVPFTNFTAFRGLGYQLKNVVKGDLQNYLAAKTYFIKSFKEAHPWSSWLKNGKTIYYSHESGMIPVPSMEVFSSNGGELKNVLNMNAEDIKVLKSGQLPLLELNDQRIYK